MPEVKISNWPSFLESPPNYYYYQSSVGDKDEKYNQTLYGFISYPLYDPVISTGENFTFTKKAGATITITIQQSSNFIYIKDTFYGYGFNKNDIVLLQFYYKGILYCINSKVNSCTIPTEINKTQTVIITTIEDLIISNDKSDTIKTDDFQYVKLSYQLTKYSKFVQNSNNSARLTYYPNNNIGGYVFLTSGEPIDVIAEPQTDIILFGDNYIPRTEDESHYLHYAQKHPKEAATLNIINTKSISDLFKNVYLYKDLEINNIENNTPYKEVTITLKVKITTTRKTIKYKYNLIINGGESETKYYLDEQGGESPYQVYKTTTEIIELSNKEEVEEDISKNEPTADATIVIKHTFTKQDYITHIYNVEQKLTVSDITEKTGSFQLSNWDLIADFIDSETVTGAKILKSYTRTYYNGEIVDKILEKSITTRMFTISNVGIDENEFVNEVYTSPNLSFYT